MLALKIEFEVLIWVGRRGRFGVKLGTRQFLSSLAAQMEKNQEQLPSHLLRFSAKQVPAACEGAACELAALGRVGNASSFGKEKNSVCPRTSVVPATVSIRSVL